jgi:hypothetical protein
LGLWYSDDRHTFIHQWRIVMTTLNRKNLFNPQLFILSAGLLLRAYGAFASDPSNDAQAQARALLNPSVVYHVIAAESTVSSPTGDRTPVNPDAEESARAFLSGQSITDGAARSATARSPGKESPPAASDQDYRVFSDPQEAARRMILGLGTAPEVVHLDAAKQAARMVSAR